MAALTDADKARVRYHLGYPMLDSSSYVVASAVMHSDLRLILEANMNNVSADALTYVPLILTNLDTIDAQKLDALSRLQASKADVVTLNANEQGDLQTEYVKWQMRLCNALAVTVNQWAVQGGNTLNFSRR